MAQLVIRTHDGEKFCLPRQKSVDLHPVVNTLNKGHDWVAFGGTTGEIVVLHAKTIASIHYSEKPAP